MAALMHDAMEDCGVTKAELIERFGAPTADLVDGLTKLDKLQFSTREEVAGRVVPQDAAGDGARRARHPRSSSPTGCTTCARWTRWRRPSAQRIAARDARHLRADRAPAGPEPDLPRAAGAVVPAPAPVAPCARCPRRCRRRAATGATSSSASSSDVEKAFAQAKMQVQVVGREKTLLLDLPQDAREAPELRAGERHLRLSHRRAARCPSATWRWACCTSSTSRCPGRFKDYIAIPKANGYQSLHTTLVSPLGTAVEFQIRTEPMHAVAEKGIAAHWLYKANDNGGARRSEAQRLGAMWLQSLIDIQDETRDASEFLEHVKIDLFPDAVYVFTPKSQDPRAAARRHAGRLRLRDPLRRRRPLRRRQGQRRAGGAAHRAAQRRRGRDRQRARRAAQPGLAELRAHRPRALEDPPLPEEHGAGGVAATWARSCWRRRCAPKGCSCPPARDDAGRGAVAAADALERQPHPRRAADRHRPGPQDRHHRRQAPGAADGRARHAPDARDADAWAATPATTRRRRRAWS